MTTMNRTLWRPDTCGCEITLEWDPNAPSEERTHIAAETKACAHHATHEHEPTALRLAAVLADVLVENRRKNRAIGAIVDQFPAITDLATRIAWRFDDRRHLLLAVTGLTTLQRTVAQQALDTRLGAGTATIE